MVSEDSSYPPTPADYGSSSTVASSLFLDDERQPRPRHKRAERAFATKCATVDNPDAGHADQHGSSSVPIYQSATFKGLNNATGYDYTRSGNPTRTFLQNHIAKIANAKHSFVVSSGMGALDVIFRSLKPGDEIITGNDLYGGSNRLLTYLRTNGGVAVHHLDTTDSSLLLPYLEAPNSKVRYVLLESPTNPLLQIVDIEEIATLVHRHIPDAVVIVDNTMMSPFLQRPLELGADIVYDSATKYLSGHHDLMAGAIYCNRDDLAKQMAFTINTIGNGLSPFDSFLLLRGIKTMALRMERQQATACLVASYLHRLGFRVNFPALTGHRGKEVHDRIAKGPGAVLSFETGDVALSEKVVGATRLWGISVSFGAVNSLISMPCLMSHASIDPKVRKERNLPEHLIRLCVGIEDPDDLLDDLEAALLQAGALRAVEDPEYPGEQKLERAPLPGEEADELQHGVEGSSLADRAEKGNGAGEDVDFVTSAPGKVILFGEHAVVHGVTAVAGALDLRCFCHVESRKDDKIALILPDIGLERTWDISSLPFAALSEAGALEDVEHDTLPNSTASPNPAVLAILATSGVLTDPSSSSSPSSSKQAAQAALSAQAFLYLYMRLSKRDKLARTFTVRSALPIGAGLGSSAAFSVCIASALLYLNGHLDLPAQSFPSSSTISHDAAHLVNSWAFVGEKILHGNPSGVDNSVATLGGALVFQKSRFVGEAPSMRTLQGFRSIRFLLTDTKIPRDTKTLVAGVARKKELDPDWINELLSEVQRISDQAVIALDSHNLSREDQLASLEKLVDRNHEILNQLGVGHAALEAIKVKAAQPPNGLHTKLTGAGGGGCAVTIIPDSFSEEQLQLLKAELHADGFACYETAVGGHGVGVLVLPPASAGNATHAPAEGGAEEEIVPLRSQFETAPTVELHSWAEGIGEWAYA